MNYYSDSNVGSNRGKHTDYARLTSIFKKLDNQLSEDKVREKKAFVKIDKRDNTEIIL